MYALFPTIGNITAATIVLAHQGGWDELLMVAVPVAVFAGLLYVANNRASKLGDGTSDDQVLESGSEGSEFRGGGGDGRRDGGGGGRRDGGTDGTGAAPVKRPLHDPPPRNPRGGPI
ncbi:MAG: hypothetical protein WBA45_15695 [Microthrixaceae bacterium]